MSKEIHIMREVFRGTRAVRDEVKYLVFSLGAAAIHLVFSVFFGIYGISGMFQYNVAITVLYLYLGFVRARKKKFTGVLIVTLVEVLLHSSVACILLGWDWGFMLYTIALVPITFYLTYTLPKFKKGLVFPIVWSLVVAVCYFGIRILCWQIDPVYEGSYPYYLPRCFYYFNMFVTFMMLLVFSILFALEIRYMQGKLERENKTLGEAALYDPLTHLLNRRSMDRFLEEAYEGAAQDGSEFCLIMSDIDDFKNVNDTYGHACGDKVLVKVAEVMKSCVRRDDYVCRWGGEEMLLLIRAGRNTAVKAAERICSEVAAASIWDNDREIRVTLTLGVSSYCANSTIHSMISEADQNLYRGKKNGKNQVVAP